jgi:hypothetical protein
LVIGAACVVVVMTARTASAQTADRPASAVFSVLKQVTFDPSTYVPAIVGYDATLRDWNSSQPLFRNGFVERNARFTISGWPNDAPISYEAGKRRILSDALANLRISVVDNLSTAVVEHILVKRYPGHRKLVRTLGWVQRITLASYLSYQMSARHYQQWQDNDTLVRQLGLP